MPDRPSVHEAGHVIVADAVGRHVLEVTLGRINVPADHPALQAGEWMVGDGRTVIGPLLREQIIEQWESNQPYTQEQVRWLWAELAISMAGVAAEVAVFGSATELGAELDLRQAAAVANTLGLPGDPAREALVDEAEELAKGIVDQHRQGLLAVAESFAPPCSFDVRAVRALLDDLGFAHASHSHRIEELIAAAG